MFKRLFCHIIYIHQKLTTNAKQNYTTTTNSTLLMSSIDNTKSYEPLLEVVSSLCNIFYAVLKDGEL